LTGKKRGQLYLPFINADVSGFLMRVDKDTGGWFTGALAVTGKWLQMRTTDKYLKWVKIK